MTSAIALAVRLTRSDSPTIPASSGSSRAISAKAETTAWVKSFMPACLVTPGGIRELCSHPENYGNFSISILGQREKISRQQLTAMEQKKNIVAFASYRNCLMSSHLQPDDQDEAGLEAAVEQAIAACGGDHRATIRALVVANNYLENEV